MIRTLELFPGIEEFGCAEQCRAMAAEFVLGIKKASIKNTLVSKTVSKSFESSYSAHGNAETHAFVLMGLIHSLTQDYIHAVDLKAGDPEYDKLIDNLSLLSGQTNQEYMLSTEDIEYCIAQALLPINFDHVYGYIDPEQPLNFVPKKHFDNVLSLFAHALLSYEIPAQGDFVHFLNFLLHEYIPSERDFHLMAQRGRQLDDRASNNIDKKENKGSRDIDL